MQSSDYGVSNQVKSAVYSLSQISNISNEIEELKNRLNSCLYEVTDIVDGISDILSKVEYDEDEVNNVEERLDLIKDLKRKYGGSVEQIFEYLNNAKQKLDNLNNSEEAIKKLNTQKRLF